MSFTAWYFRRVEPGLFVGIPRAAHTDFWRGSKSLSPDSETGDVLIADVGIVLRERVARSLNGIRFDRYPVDAGGRRDAAHRREEGRAYETLAGVYHRRAQLTAEDRFSERVIVGQYQWEPSNVDRTALVDAINRRAGRHIAGPSHLRLT